MTMRITSNASERDAIGSSVRRCGVRREQKAAMDPTLVSIGATREEPVLASLDEIDIMPGKSLGELRARDIRLGVHRSDGGVHARAARCFQLIGHFPSARPGTPSRPTARRTARSIASSSAATVLISSGMSAARGPSG